MGDSVNVPFALFMDANEDTMIQRIIERANTSGRLDDNVEQLKKRFAIYNDEEMPIVEIFEKKGQLRRINALQNVDEVYIQVVALVN